MDIQHCAIKVLFIYNAPLLKTKKKIRKLRILKALKINQLNKFKIEPKHLKIYIQNRTRSNSKFIQRDVLKSKKRFIETLTEIRRR